MDSVAQVVSSDVMVRSYGSWVLPFRVCRLVSASAYLKVQLSDIEGEDTGLQEGQSLESNC